MNSKCDAWKVLQLFMIAVNMAIVSDGLLKLRAAQAKTILDLNIEERLTIVREKLKQKEEHSEIDKDRLLSIINRPEIEENKNFQVQWPNYWRDWRDVPFNNWSDRPWSNWSDWRNWGDSW